ncbi:MAG: RES family NAD+ phosphorylase [Pseudomonadota bacterium]|nr:RES family NAD+ phosphorylase [Pseudomonadota bacterium]
MTVPETRVTWDKYYRLINSVYPPIDLFEDIADPEDWLLLGSAESKTNPRLAQTIGNLDLVPKERRVGGPGSSYLMAPFVHVTPDHNGRFHDGTFGALYAADTFEAALFETIYHTQRFCAATGEEPGWIADKRELIGCLDTTLCDIRDGYSELLDPDDYTASQVFARDQRNLGANGILYPSVRFAGGSCIAAFHPDVVGVPIQGRHITYHWNGARIDMFKDLSDSSAFAITE